MLYFIDEALALVDFHVHVGWEEVVPCPPTHENVRN